MLTKTFRRKTSVLIDSIWRASVQFCKLKILRALRSNENVSLALSWGRLGPMGSFGGE